MIKYTISQEDHVVIAQASANFDTQSFIDHMMAINTDERFSNDMNGIYDFSAVTKVTGDPKCLLLLAEQIRDSEYMPNACLIATICPPDNPMYRVLEGYFIMVRGTNLIYRFFDETQAGLKWIGLTNDKYQNCLKNLPTT